jgi:hypothetical protein
VPCKWSLAWRESAVAGPRESKKYTLFMTRLSIAGPDIPSWWRLQIIAAKQPRPLPMPPPALALQAAPFQLFRPKRLKRRQAGGGAHYQVHSLRERFCPPLRRRRAEKFA